MQIKIIIVKLCLTNLQNTNFCKSNFYNLQKISLKDISNHFIQQQFFKLQNLMNAPHNPKIDQSHINILFGQPITSHNPPINIRVQFGIFSQKHANIFFNLKEMLDTNIQKDTLIIELKSKIGFGSNLSDSIQTFLKTSQTYLKLYENKEINIRAVGKGQKAYILMKSSKVTEEIQTIIADFKNLTKQQHQSHSNAISVQLRSLNTFSKVKKLLDTQGAMRAAFDSLLINIIFKKNKLVEQVIERFLSQLQLVSCIGPLKAFKNVNLDINFSSSQIFDRYQQLRSFAKVFKKINTNFFSSIRGQYHDQARIHYFSEVFSFTGSIHGQDIEAIFETLFGQQVVQK